MEKKSKIIENPRNVFLFEVLFFLLAQILGIFSALRVLEIFELEKITPGPVSFWNFIFGFAFATFLILVLIKFPKFETGKRFLFRGFFILTISLGSFLFFSLWIGDFLALILLLILLFLWIKFPNVLVHDFLIISGLAGVGSIFGLGLEPLVVVLLLIVFSIYDFIAVYKTKHMVKMAKEMIKARAIVGLILPQKTSGFKANLKEVVPGKEFLVLGGGDIIFPLILSVSLLSQGILKSFIVALFATFGLALSFYLFISQKTRKPIPALPPIAFCSIIGFLLTLILR